MIHSIQGAEAFVAVPSAGRPGNVAQLEAVLHPLRPTWVVPDDEAGLYLAAGAEHVIGEGSRTSIVCVRNRILELAFERNAIALMIDDDLRALSSVGRPGGKSERILSLGFYGLLLNDLKRSPYYLAGPNTTNNSYFVRTPYSTKLFVATASCAVKPCELRFDTHMRVKEDYDFTCQHIARYGGALRVNRLLPTFTYKTNSGGCQDTRTEGVERAAIERLMQKWPQWIRVNPRRENEVLLRVPKNATDTRDVLV